MSGSPYAQLADALLGKGVRPFSHFQPPPDMGPSFWYPHSSLSVHLAVQLAKYVHGDGWILELGSFIGTSASTYAKALQYLHKDRVVVVCMDTWLGDVNMWEWKGSWLGPASRSGEPRLFEQFKLNIMNKSLDNMILPVRTSASVGLRYLSRQVTKNKVQRPAVIYVDSGAPPCGRNMCNMLLQ